MTTNPWKYVQAPDVSKNLYVHPPAPGTAPTAGAARGAPASGGSTFIQGDYDLMAQTTTYALGVHALRESYTRGECPQQPTLVIGTTTLPRPLTFKQNIEARVNDYERMKPSDERLRLFKKWYLFS